MEFGMERSRLAVRISYHGLFRERGQIDLWHRQSVQGSDFISTLIADLMTRVVYTFCLHPV
jgi:hypothetical protein